MRIIANITCALFMVLTLLGLSPETKGGTSVSFQFKPYIKVVNEKGKSTTLTADQIAKLPRVTMKVKDTSGAEVSYEGVALDELLKAADVALGSKLKGPLQQNCLLVEAADGYKVVFSLPEVDPTLSGKTVLFADKKDGKLLDEGEGPFRFVVPHETMHMRWIRQVISISVTPVGPPKAK
jgi:hypothetical protein